MTEKEAGKLLLCIRDCIPNFQPSATAPKTWKRVLGNMSYEEAERHLDEHFRESKFAPTPYEIISRARSEFDPDKIVPVEPPVDMGGGLTNGV